LVVKADIVVVPEAVGEDDFNWNMLGCRCWNIVGGCVCLIHFEGFELIGFSIGSFGE
jgi:hypothetical protein